MLSIGESMEGWSKTKIYAWHRAQGKSHHVATKAAGFSSLWPSHHAQLVARRAQMLSEEPELVDEISRQAAELSDRMSQLREQIRRCKTWLDAADVARLLS